MAHYSRNLGLISKWVQHSIKVRAANHEPHDFWHIHLTFKKRTLWVLFLNGGVDGTVSHIHVLNLRSRSGCAQKSHHGFFVEPRGAAGSVTSRQQMKKPSE